MIRWVPKPVMITQSVPNCPCYDPYCPCTNNKDNTDKTANITADNTDNTDNTADITADNTEGKESDCTCCYPSCACAPRLGRFETV